MTLGRVLRLAILVSLVVFVSLELPAAVALPTPGPVSLWKADGDFADSADSNPGTPFDGVAFAVGRVNQAFSLSGGGQYIDFGNPANLNVSSGDFTVAALVNFNSTSGGHNGDMDIVSKMIGLQSPPNRDGWRLLKQQDNHLWFCFGQDPFNGCFPGSTTTVISTNAVSAGAWYHVAGVKRSSQIEVWVNGVREAITALGAFTDSASASLKVGVYAPGFEGSYLNGLVDETQIYDRALAAADIWDLAHPMPDISGHGRFGTDGDWGRVDFTLSNERVTFDRGTRFSFSGEVESVTGSGKEATLT